jgi:hypothetical protein
MIGAGCDGEWMTATLKTAGCICSWSRDKSPWPVLWLRFSKLGGKTELAVDCCFLLICWTVRKWCVYFDWFKVCGRKMNQHIGHSLKLYVPRSSTTIRQNFFSVRVVKNWNNLPQHVCQRLQKQTRQTLEMPRYGQIKALPKQSIIIKYQVSSLSILFIGLTRIVSVSVENVVYLIRIWLD